MHEVKIFNEIQNNKKILIFDLRTVEEYKANHIDLSINIPYNEHDNNFFETICDKKFNLVKDQYMNNREVKQRIETFKRYYIVLIMSQKRIKKKKIENFDSTEVDKDEKDRIIKTLLFYESLILNGVREIGVYNLGIDKMVEKYDFITHIYGQDPLAK
jgi:hypothetical protein